MSWTDPKTWKSEIVSASDLNPQIRDNLTFLYDQIETSLHFEVIDVYGAGASTQTLVGLPSYSVALEVLVYVVAAFNDEVSIGDENNNEGFMTEAQVDATNTGWKGEGENDRGVYLWNARRLVKGYHQAKDIQAYSNASSGHLKAFIMYGK